MPCLFLTKKKRIRQACISKINSERSNQEILSMITEGKKWHYLAVKSLCRLLRAVILNHDGDYYCMNCLYSFATENKLKSHENVCKKHDYCHTVMPEECKKILKCNQDKKYLKIHSLSMLTQNHCLKKLMYVITI